jgi:3-(3-hydroxy-phenyl)propionate hydroxylase
VRPVLTDPAPHYPVAIVGAGPTGLTTANLLGRAGVRTLVIERNPTTVQQPRAVSIDDEALRTIQAAGLADAVIPRVALDYGSHYLSAAGRCFAKVEPTTREYGYPRRNAFRQPELEATLRDGLRRFPNVEAIFEHEVEDLEQDESGVRLRVRKPDGAVVEVACDTLAGCDGGRSTVRHKLGIDMVGSTYNERWLIIDLEGTRDRYRQTRVYCDLAEPGINLPGPDETRRFEFMLHPDETEDAVLDPANIRRLLESHGPDADATIRRAQVYTFHARTAERWSDGRIHLLGDAAHLTPPFAGQGMNSGLRDAANFAWKAAAVAKGELGPALLDSYEIERRPHAWALIEMAIMLGRVMMPRSPVRAWLTQAGFRVLGLSPRAQGYITEMKYKPKPRFAEGFLVPDGRRPGRTLVGRLFPQPRIETADRRTMLLDEALGDGFCLLAFAADPERAFAGIDRSALAAMGIATLCVTPRRWNVGDGDGGGTTVRDIDGATAAAVEGYDGDLLLLRPDRYVAAVFSGSRPDAMLPAIEGLLRSTWREGGLER